MSKDIVKYGNDFNLLPMPQLKALQMDIFMAILSLVKEKKENVPYQAKFFNPKLRKLIIPQKDFINLCRLQDSNLPYTDIFWLIDDTLKKLVKTIIAYQKDEKTIYNFVCFEIGAIIDKEIHITFTKAFYDMIMNYKYGFTAFELSEFVNLGSKYTKTLYRLLKQYRTTGKFIIKFSNFLEIMGIPPSYKMADIDRQILKPTISELAEPTFFDADRIPFENLKYKKIKGKGRGQGGNVIGIEFTFTPQRKPNELELAQETIKAQAKQIEAKEKEYNFAEEHIVALAHALGVKNEYQHYVGRNYRNSQGECLKILDIIKLSDGELKVEFKNQETEKKFYRNYPSENHLKKYLDLLSSF